MKKFLPSFLLLALAFVGNNAIASDIVADRIFSGTEPKFAAGNIMLNSSVDMPDTTGTDSSARCYNGKIVNSNVLCVGGHNYFKFNGDSIMPVDFADPNLQFIWTVTDGNGDPVPFVPVYSTGSGVPVMIDVSFPLDGGYTVTLEIISSVCRTTFREDFRVEGCKCGDLKGSIKKRQKKACIGEKTDFYFDRADDSYSYEWVIVDSNNQSHMSDNGAPDISTVFNQTGNYTVLLTVTDGSGCAYFYILNVTVENCRGECVWGTIVNSNLCADGDNYFHFQLDPSTPLDFSDPDLEFHWSVADLNGNPVNYQPVVAFGNTLPYYIIVQSAGTFVIQLTIKNKTCAKDFSTTVQINRCECKPIEGKIRQKEKRICAGDYFSIVFSNPDAGHTYQWNVLNGNYQSVYTQTGSLEGFQTSMILPGEYLITLTVTDANGCQSFFLFGLKVENCDNKCRFGSILNTALCAGHDNYFHFNAHPSTPIDFSDPNLQFDWSVEDDLGNPVAFQPVFLYGAAVPYYIIVQSGGILTVRLIIKTKECEDKFEKTVTIDKCGCEPIKGEISQKDERICAGKQFQLNFSAPTSGSIYQWNILNSGYQSVFTASGTMHSINPTVNLPEEYLVTLTVTDEKGCESFFVYPITVKNCGDNCYFGSISNGTLCIGADNYFYFTPDPSTPLDFSDLNLDFVWSVTDGFGNPVNFQPVYLFGNLAFYIKVPFDATGQYTVTLTIKSSRCSDDFTKTINVGRCECEIRGDVKIKGEPICRGKDIGFEFIGHQSGYSYSWNIFDHTYQSVSESTGTTPAIGLVLNNAGSYALVLTVTGPDGCQSIFVVNFKVDECGPVSGDCHYHLGFSFATPNDSLLNNAKRLSMVEGIVNFVNQNVDGKLFLTSMDDHSSGTRFSAKQSIVNVQWNQPYTNSSSETMAFNSIGNAIRVRVQNDNYANTITKEFNALANAADLTMPMNVHFVIVSNDSNTEDIIAGYNNLLASGKAQKIYFVVFEGGVYKVGGAPMSPQAFVSHVIGAGAVNYASTNNVLNSNYVVVPSSAQGSGLNAFFKSFLQSAYNSVKGSVICPDCVKGEISSAATLCAETDNAFWFTPTGTINATDPQLSFAWTVTSNGNPVYHESFGAANTAISIPGAPAGNYTVSLVITTSTCTKTYVKNVSIGNCNVGSCGNATNQYYVVGLFRSLLTHLRNQPAGSVTNGYTCPEMVALQTYINPTISNPAIYNFTKVNNTMSFSFSPNAVTPHVVLKMPSSSASYLQSISLGGAYTNMANQTPFMANYFVLSGIIPQHTGISGSSVSQVNFCPTELHCVNHIAIVLDESTSITPVDAGRIRKQLKNFVEQQVAFSQTYGSQLRLSLIGLSDEDMDYRPDHKINKLVNAANKTELLNWINGYKNRYNHGIPGVTSNSDYWNSGLSRALQTDASLVILITDGAQTGNINVLKATMDQFNNGGNTGSDRHLHVIGLTNGFYVDGNAPSGRYSDTANPNLVKGMTDEDEVSLAGDGMGETMRLTDFLRISLRYLIYENAQFPIEDVNNFNSDYSGHDNFKFLYDNPYYLSNNLFSYLEGTCGEMQYLDNCDECYGVQLEPAQSYVISAWVHVDKTRQVTSFMEDGQTPAIKIIFSPDDPEGDPNPDASPVVLPPSGNVPGSYTFHPQGNIIDGWQRIFGVFTVHPNTVYMRVMLNNNSPSDAMYFDDLRIHPLDGNMKSFVYDQNNYRLMSELDENNYSTYYEYDAQGNLVRIKKETEKGIQTIQESRSGTSIKQQ